MRAITLKRLKIKHPLVPADVPETDFDYAEHIRQAVGVFGSPKGENHKMVRVSVNVMNAVEKAQASPSGVVYLEEADYAHLAKMVEGMEWRFAHKSIVEFTDDVMNAPKVDAADIIKAAVAETPAVTTHPVAK